jgi:hypothetical protein
LTEVVAARDTEVATGAIRCKVERKVMVKARKKKSVGKRKEEERRGKEKKLRQVEPQINVTKKLFKPRRRKFKGAYLLYPARR